ncbi:flavin reductase family protein [Nonomuraea sp. NPDC050202]|jgi:flavin reductase ActVB|uniref:flavin reductase family protein n=1 Tax=Nonomuraea sp. NPDC050202 TaxID=3155035 RepID=UPI0033FD75A5
MTVETQTLKQALAKYVTGITVVTTTDSAGRRWGFTASSFTPVSLDPPQILVCIARSAQCHATFMETDEFAVNVLTNQQEAVAERFARRGGDKFAGFPFEAGSHGLPVLDKALAVFECETRDRFPAGDHTILLGEVSNVRVSNGVPALYFDRKLRRVPCSQPLL